MAGKKTVKKARPKSPGRRSARGEGTETFTDEERAAMREYVRERKSAAKRPRGGDESEEDAVLAKIAAMAPEDRAIGERVHAIVRASAPGLTPKLWYGMPAYAKDGKVVCFFQGADKFKTRYATLGFSDKAALDEGHMWPTAFALQELTADVEAMIGALVRRAVSG